MEVQLPFFLGKSIMTDKPYYQQPTETDMREAIKALMKQFVEKEKVFSSFFLP